MDELQDDSAICVRFPVWFLVHPTLLARAFLEVTGAKSEKSFPLFTDRDFAKKFQDETPALSHYVAANAHRDQLVGVLDALEADGFTHVTFNHARRDGKFLLIAEVRDSLR